MTEFDLIHYTLPDVAGAHEVDVEVTVPDPWVCVINCYDEKTVRMEHVTYMGYDGLEPLPQGPNHFVVRGDSDVHPEGTHGTPEAVQGILSISQLYVDESGFPVSLNDISLPRGGIFDYRQTSRWNPPHSLHQWGTDVDFNRVDGSGEEIPCYRNYNMHNAVKGFNEDLDNETQAPVEFMKYCTDRDHVLAGNYHLLMDGLSAGPEGDEQ